MNNSSLKSITVKRIPPKLYQQLKTTAAANHRSLNSEMLFCLESTLQPRKPEPEALFRRLDALNAELQIPPLTQKMLDEAIKKGRR